MPTTTDPTTGLQVVIPAGATIQNGRVVGSNGADLGDVSAFATDVSLLATPTQPRTWGDIQRQNAANARELGANAAVGGAGALAQLALSQIPTATDTRNAERLASLEAAEKAGNLGLTGDERAQVEADVLNPARAEAAQRQAQTGQRLASAGGASLATQQAMEAADAKAAQAGLIQAGAEMSRENLAKTAANEKELEERTQYQANKQSALYDQISQAVGDLAKMGGRVAAAQVSRTEPSDADLVAMSKQTKADGTAMYPAFVNKSPDEIRAIQKQQMALDRARKAEPVNVRTKPTNAQAPLDNFNLDGTATLDASTAASPGL